MFVHALFQKSSQFLLDFVFPPHCVNCKKVEDWLCQKCLQQVSIITGTICVRCGTPISTNLHCLQCENHPLHAVDGIRAASFFENNPIRSAIHSLKYRNYQAAATRLSKLLVEAHQRYKIKADVIVPVPLHTSRLRERGFNQSELLARAVGKYLDLPIDGESLIRVRQTKPQVELRAMDRYENVLNAFSCRNTRLAGRKIVLIDDVCTTGSTLDACAVALKKSGAASVWGLTLAKASV